MLLMCTGTLLSHLLVLPCLNRLTYDKGVTWKGLIRVPFTDDFMEVLDPYLLERCLFWLFGTAIYIQALEIGRLP